MRRCPLIIAKEDGVPESNISLVSVMELAFAEKSDGSKEITKAGDKKRGVNWRVRAADHGWKTVLASAQDELKLADKLGVPKPKLMKLVTGWAR